MARLFVEELTVVDAALLDADDGLVGDSWIVDVELEGDLDGQGMVLDFSSVKRDLKRLIDGDVDHRLLVPARLPGLSVRRSQGRLSVECDTARGHFAHESPHLAVQLIEAARVDATTLAQHLERRLAGSLPARVHGLRLGLRREAIDGAWYRYVHGLKKHDGPCQRIAHGHRSRLEIRAGGHRRHDLEAMWAQRWADRYLATRDDLAGRSDGQLRFQYESSEGTFRLSMPEARCEVLACDTTVEHLAQFIAERLAESEPRARLEVRAYEGVRKGAIARTAA